MLIYFLLGALVSFILTTSYFLFTYCNGTVKFVLVNDDENEKEFDMIFAIRSMDDFKKRKFIMLRKIK